MTPTEPMPSGLSSALLEDTPRRARKFFGVTARGAGAAESAGSRATESSGSRRGPPNARDEELIATKLRHLARLRPPNQLLGDDPDAHADALAHSLVQQASAAVEKLDGGAADGALTAHENVALEAVLHTRGRPALKLDGQRVESLNETDHPGSGFWRAFLDDNEDRIVSVANATGAVRVQSFSETWVQGTAWLVDKEFVVTNRHVLFPALGERLARRHDQAPETARMKMGLTVTIDFAFDNGPSGRKLTCNVVDVPYVSLEADPIDIAILRIEPLSAAAAPAPLVVSKVPFDADQLYIVGHPGKLEEIPDSVNAVFGSPDEHKRVSFGELMDADAARPAELIHDASTIGGYSGGCVLGFASREVVGLHYFGDPTAGNRAFKSTALRTHKVNSFLR